MARQRDLTFPQKLDALEAGAKDGGWEKTLAKAVTGALKALFGDDLDVGTAPTVKMLVEKAKELSAANAEKTPALEALLDPILELYGRETSYGELERKVRLALKEKLNLDDEHAWDFWIQDMFPTYFVYDHDGKAFSIAYTMREDGAVEFGDPQEVKRVWVPAKEAAPPVPEPEPKPVTEDAPPTPVSSKNQTRMEVLETFQGMEAEFDDKSMKAVVTIIKPGTSLNNRHYTEAAIASGYQLFEKAKMYVNHPPKTAAAGPRGLESLVSATRRTWVDEDTGSMKGEVKFFRRDFYEFVKEAKDDIGVSINALCAGQQGVMVDGKKVDIIEAFVRANSVDWVTDAGAGGGVDAVLEGDYSYTREEQMSVLEGITLDDLTKERPDLVKTITDGVGLEAVQTELAEAKTKLEAMEAKVTAAETLEQIRTIVNGEERLPEKSRERIIKALEGRTFEEGKLESTVKEAVESELEYLGDLGVKPGETPAPTSTPKPTVISNVGEGAPAGGSPEPGFLNNDLDKRLGIQAAPATN